MLYSERPSPPKNSSSGPKAPTALTTIPADLAITDEYDVVHRVWKLTDPHLINLIVTAMADKKLIIADGHHRYETSVAYAKERSAQLKLPLNQPRDEDEKLSPSHLPSTRLPRSRDDDDLRQHGRPRHHHPPDPPRRPRPGKL